MLFLREHDIESLITMPLAIDTMEEAFRAMANGQADNSPRVRVKAAGILLHSMTAAAEYLGLVGWKQYTTTRQGAKFLIGLYSQASGELIAMLEADRLGQVRTGAVTGLAVRRLAPLDVEEVGLFGTGWQAEGQLAAVAAERPLKRAYVYGRDAGRRTAFAERTASQLQLDVVACDQPRDVVEQRPLIVTATSSREPVFEGAWLSDGALVCAVGSNRLQSAEFDVTTARRARYVVCDDVECCRRESGDLHRAAEAGAFAWDDALGLAELVAGDPPARSAADVVLFKSVGMAIEDVALGGRLLQRALEANLGEHLPIGADPHHA